MLILKDVLKGFVSCGMWLAQDDIDSEALSIDFVEDSLEFCQQAIDSVELKDQALYLSGAFDSVQFGHDLFLTCNGHGVGFWDRELGALGERLTAISEALGGFDLYLGDDELIYSTKG